MANDLLHHTIMRVARIGRNGEGINVGVATIVLFTNMTIKMAVLSIPVEVAVCTPRAITRGKIAISTLRVATKMIALADFGVGGVDDSFGSRRLR